MQELIQHDFTFFFAFSAFALYQFIEKCSLFSSLLLNPFTGLQVVDWSVKGDNMLQIH